MLDDISFVSNISETSLRLPGRIGATFTKMTESRSTQTTTTEIPSDQLHCLLCGSQKLPRSAEERFQNTLGYTESVLGDRFCSPCDTCVLEPNQLSSAFQKTTRQEQRFSRQNPPKKFESPRIKEAKELKLRSSALQQKRTREQRYSKTQTALRESTVSPDPCGDSKLVSSSDRRVKEPVNPFPKLGSNRRLSNDHDTHIEEFNHLFSSRLRSTTKQDESFSQRKNFRTEKPATINPRVQILFNTRSEELNAYPSPSLDHISADSDTGEIHLGFTSLNNGPKRSSERPETESATRQYRRHPRNRHSARNMRTPAFTVWNTRN